ncbi:MAG TPA: alpha/beta hydrolase [Cycloclasticus sp.]|jgi:pimeloyl-ACP methyl ester carboxylesterase|nr:alpha/beta hydrolase [Cycloclasticus sp.]HIL93640.1 alpha/beta hydrolase [Cycloclasticus sp.]
MKTQYVTSCSIGGLHKLAYKQWGDADNPDVLICSHGLTRNKHDFDVLAQKLSAKRRVICFDLPGRGESDWLVNKMAYDYNQYTVDALMIIARAGVEKVDWLGTSMGGLLGMALASLPDSPIKKLIINDVGPHIPKESLKRIADYVGQQPTFDTADELGRYIRTVYAGFGKLSEKQWNNMLTHGQRTLSSGQFTLNYDPDISKVFMDKPLEDLNLWPVWNAITQATLVIKGEDSDLLLAETAEKMTTTGPKAELITIENTAHAPALMNDTDINLVEDWLQSNNR